MLFANVCNSSGTASVLFDFLKALKFKLTHNRYSDEGHLEIDFAKIQMKPVLRVSVLEFEPTPLKMLLKTDIVLRIKALFMKLHLLVFPNSEPHSLIYRVCFLACINSIELDSSF